MIAGLVYQFRNKLQQLFFDQYCFDLLTEAIDLVSAQYRLYNIIDIRIAHLMKLVEYRQFFAFAWVWYYYLEKKTVELCFRQTISALLLYRVLSGQYHEWCVHFIGPSINRSLS